ncbi:MAG: ImmA/IrrE family metallo-endopeptidase [Clostridia bacterium]|nr:ImmA/IrrE family metallo-endopeptidase [Clostridia bacterium]
MATTESIIKTVDKLIRQTDSRDPFEICRQLGIRIRYHELGKIKAYFFCQSRIKNIVINSNTDDIARKILCAHELGHAILHGRIASDHGFHEITLFDSTTPTEYEANLFAAELLISDDEIIDLMDGKSFFEIAKTLCVPSALVDFKCQILKKKGYDIAPPSLSDSHFLKDDKI